MENMNVIEAIEVNTEFKKLMSAVNEIQSKCNDDIVTAKDIRMDDDLNLVFDDKKMQMSAFASSGLCGKLKIPTVYYNRCAEQNKPLAARNVNAWLFDDNRKFMVREYDGHIRGLLSGSYSKFDAPEILEAMNNALGFDNYKLKGSFVNEERLHIRLVEKEMLPIDGEDLFAGITLDSSDIGRSGLYVRFFIYKQVCTNGLIIPKSSGELFRQKHIGISSEEFQNGLIEGLKSFNDIKENVTEMILESKDTNIDIDKIVEDVKQRTKLTDDAIDEIVMLADTSYERSRWGIINGITEVAQKYTLERRLQLEQIAGEMLAVR